MASKQFHLTPDGPKKCTALFRKCKYDSHYSSEESAVTAERIVREKSEQKLKISQLKKNINNFEPENHIRSFFTLTPNSNSQRNFAEELEAREANYGRKPELYHSIGKFRLSERGYEPVEVQLLRMDMLDQQAEKYIGDWTISTTFKDISVYNPEPVVQKMSLNFSTESESKKSFLKASEIFRTAVVTSGVRDDDLADKKADEMLTAFKRMYTSIETEAEGEVDLWERGIGYFSESDGEAIRVNEDFSNSSFRPKNFENFLKNNDHYALSTPEAQVRVTDSNPKNGTSWSLYKKDGQWSVKIHKLDQSVSDPVCQSPDDVYSHVFYAAYEGTNVNDEKESHRKARYASNLMKTVEDALRENDKRVAAAWEEERVAKEERRNRAKQIASSNSDDNTIHKIFDAFSSKNN